VRKNLVLLGMMGVGKTTVGKIVAKKQNLEFIDIDKNIEEKCSMKISEIFKKKGEKFFRIEEEKEVLKSLKKENCIIALGGGAFLNNTIRDNVLKNSIAIWLDADIKTLEKRVKWNEKRPLLKKNNKYQMIKKIYLERKKIYKLAKYKIKCDKMNKSDLIKKIILLYEQQ
jgi:shikimate kinase